MRCTLPQPRLALVIGLALNVVACGTGFDPASEVTTLRVLGVQKSSPYPQPGEAVDLSVLWHDGATDPATPRDVQVLWLPPCFNPPGDQFEGCATQFLERFVEDPELLNQLREGNTNRIDIPLDIVQPNSAPGNPRYGLTIASFTVCTGTVSFEEPEEGGALPLICRNAAGERLGPDSFVVVQSKMFTYADLRDDGQPFQNANPILMPGFSVAGETLESCLGEECLTPPMLTEADIDCEATPERCIPSCDDDGDPDCPEIEIRPLVDQSSAEPDDVSRAFYGRNVTEQMWINYYVDRGSVRGDGVRLLNDATTGWNEDYGTELYAPKDPGLVTLWAVVHDNRGGMSWTRTQIKVE
jgi:hypothetical protein